MLLFFSKLTGTWVNCGTVILGCIFGLLLKKGLPKRVETMVMQAVSLSVLFIGISGLKDSQNTMVLIISMVIGTVIGCLINLDGIIHKLGDKVETKLSSNKNLSSGFSEGFVTSTLLFCVGAMAVVGSLSSGLKLDHSTLFSKAILDGITSMILASSLGFGVIFSIIPLLIYQGGITLLSGVLAPLLSATVVNEMSAVGSLLIIALSLNMLKITNIKIMNMLPAIFLPIFIYMLPIF